MYGSSPLAGVRVLELTDLSGMFAGRLLAMLGADVVLAEPPAGHGLRAGSDVSFWYYAAGKRSVIVDVADDPERLLGRLVDSADGVIVTGAANLSAVSALTSSKLVTAVISPFGTEGRFATWRSSDLVAQAMGGMLGASGRPDGPPLPALGLQAYHQAGIFAAIGFLAALLARERTGRGQRVDVSIHAAVAASLEHVHGRYLHDGTVTRRGGGMHWTRRFRVGPARDGWGVRTTFGDWTTLVEWMKADGMAEDLEEACYEDDAVRGERAEHVFDVIDAWAQRYDTEELATQAQARRLAFAAVRPPEALLHDPQLAARGFFVSIDRAASDRQHAFPGPPFRLGPLPPGFAHAPRLGEHATDIVHEWLAGPRRARSRANTPERPLERPLTGVRVLDFTWLVAGPVATRILADLGADVVKIEHPRTRDATDRRDGVGGALNRGKRSVVLDLASPDGRAIATQLALGADVVIDNFSARVMEEWGLDPATLRALSPRLICARMTGCGLTGPDRDQVSFGPTLQARAGYTALMTDDAGIPLGFGFSYADVASGHLGALAVLAALWRRQRTGEGAVIDFSQLEAIASLIGPTLLARSLDGAPSSPVGRTSQELPAAPHGVYPCAGDDRWVAIAVFTDADWASFAHALGDPPWTREPRFATVAARGEARQELDRLVAAWTRPRDPETVMTLLQGAGIAAGHVADAVDLCVHDAQLAASGFFVDVETPEGRTVRLGGPPFRLSDTPARVVAPGPLLGEHTSEVTAELARLADGA